MDMFVLQCKNDIEIDIKMHINVVLPAMIVQYPTMPYLHMWML